MMLDVRDQIFVLPGWIVLMYGPTGSPVYDVDWQKKLSEWLCLIRYTSEVPTRRRRTRIMDIDALVERWKEQIVGLSTSHEKQGYDEADFNSDELLRPILDAPVEQVRLFARALVAALKSDPRVPWLVWSFVEHWTHNIVLKSPEGEVIELKKELAQEVAELAEKKLSSGEWVAAIAGALQWRDPESLKKVKAALKKGGKPKITGRQSCLFLEIDADGEKVMVML